MPSVFSTETLTKFEDAAASIPLRPLDRAFEAASIHLGADPENGRGGSRRTQFRRYVASVDQGDAFEVERLGNALGALIAEVATSKVDYLVKAAESDGFFFEDGVFRERATASEPARRALVVVDVQQMLVDGLPPKRRKAFVAKLRAVIAAARAAGCPVIYVRDGDGTLERGTPGWEIAREIAPEAGDPVVDKRFRDAFRETDLARILEGLGVRETIVCGMHSEFCVDATVREAERRGYAVTLVADAHATLDVPGGLSESQIRDHVHRVLAGRIASVVAAEAVFEPV